MIRYFNRTNQSMVVSLRDGTSAFVISKGVLSVGDSQVSADVMVKVKKGFLIRLEETPAVVKAPTVKESVALPEPVSAVVSQPEAVEVEADPETTDGYDAASDLEAFLEERPAEKSDPSFSRRGENRRK